MNVSDATLRITAIENLRPWEKNLPAATSRNDTGQAQRKEATMKTPIYSCVKWVWLLTSVAILFIVQQVSTVGS